MRKFLFITIVLPILLGLVSIPLTLPVAKSIRAKQHYSKAIEFKEQENHKAAFQRILSAYNLTPQNPDVLRRLGAYGAAVNDPESLRLWFLAENAGLLDLESTIEMVEYGISSNQLDEIQPYLHQIAKEHPDDARIKSLQLRFLRLKQRNQEASELAQNLAQRGFMNQEVISTYAEHTLSSTDISEQDRLKFIQALRNAAASADEVGVFSLRTLMDLWELLEPDDKALLQLQLRKSEQSTLQDHLRLLALQRSDGMAESVLFEEVRSVYSQYTQKQAEEEGGDDGSRSLVSLVGWLSDQQLPELILQYVPSAEAIEDPDIFFSRQLALIQTDGAAEARDSTFKENPLSPTRNLVLRAIAHLALEEPESAQSNLALSVETVQLEEILWLERILLQFGQLDLAISMYETFEMQLVNPMFVRLRLIPYYYRLKREVDLRRVVADISLEAMSHSLVDQISTLYFTNLYRTNLSGTRRQAESLITEYPNLFEPRLFLGFAYALSGQPQMALEVIKGWENSNFRSDRTFTIMIGYILANNQRVEEARELLSGINPETLLDQEKVILRGLI